MIDQIKHIFAQITLTEWLAVITAFFCVWLTVKNRIENWYWAIPSVILYTIVFRDQHLYASAALNLFYFLPCCVYGYWVWKRCGPKQDDDLSVTTLTKQIFVRWLVVSVLISLLLSWFIDHFIATKDPHLYADSFTAGFSIVAQYLQARKVFENWWIWIGVDVVYATYLLPSQGLFLSMVLYIAFTLLAIRGAIEWKPLIGKPKVVPQ